MSSVSIDAEMMGRLVTQAQQGSRAAVERLIREHEGWVRSAVYAVTGRVDLVDDIVQQVWVRVWQHLASLADPRQLRGWLYRIARNAAIDVNAAEQRQRAFTGRLTTDGEDRGPTSTYEDGFGAAAVSELQETLLRAVRSLPALYREPFVLRHLEDWSYAEIGEVLGVSVDTVETRLVRARRLLREMLRGKVEI
jgi:RNA polymerase sigma factor (sigma-70 family)